MGDSFRDEVSEGVSLCEVNTINKGLFISDEAQEQVTF